MGAASSPPASSPRASLAHSPVSAFSSPDAAAGRARGFFADLSATAVADCYLSANGSECCATPLFALVPQVAMPSFPTLAGPAPGRTAGEEPIQPATASAGGHKNGGVEDLEGIFRFFMANATLPSLELPAGLTTSQRRQAKSLASQHPGLKCESFGFGEERRLHLFREETPTSRAMRRGAPRSESDEALEFTFGSTHSLLIPRQQES